MIKKNILHTLFLLFFMGNLLVQAQEGTIKGFIYDSSTGEPVPYATVKLQGQGRLLGSISDNNGSFIINKIPLGKYVLQIVIMQYEDFIDTVQVENTTHIKRYNINRSSIALPAVEVSFTAQRNLQETRTSVISITPKDMAKMPSIGGSPDFAQYLQILPGIVSTGDQGGQIYIRGGTPIQNMLLLDGMLVLNPFHSIGLFSVFDSDIIQTADVYTGGFGAEFGGRVSSVMNVQTRDGNKKKISGKVDINTFGAKVLLEGPLVKLKDDRKSSLSYILSAKGSYLDKSSKVFYPYATELPYNYMDIYGKISFSALNGSKLNLFGFNFDDKVNYSSVANYNWKNWGLGTNFLIVPGTVPTTIEGAISYSNYNSIFNEMTESFKDRASSMDVYSASLAFNYFIAKSVLNVGFNLLGYTTTYSLGSRETIDYASDLAVFIKYKYNFRDILLIEPSFRLQSYLSQNVTSPEPRLAIKYNITKKIRFKLAGGLYSQNYVAISSDRDVVNLFSGFISSVNPSLLPRKFYEKEPDNTVQRAQHLIAGLELDVVKHLSFNIEGYYKNFSVITSANRYKLIDDNSNNKDFSEYLRKDYIWEKGKAFGGDISAKFEYKGLYIWAAYTLGWVKRDDGIIEYAPHFDRRHNVNIILSYAFGKRSSWQFDVRWNFGSGFPFTQTQANYPYLSFTEGIGSSYIESNEELNFILADLNKGRLPNYHRLDVSAKKKFYLGKRHVIDISLSASNAYNYQNIFYVNRATNEKIYQLPFLYNVGLSWSF